MLTFIVLRTPRYPRYIPAFRPRLVISLLHSKRDNRSDVRQDERAGVDKGTTNIVEGHRICIAANVPSIPNDGKILSITL